MSVVLYCNSMFKGKFQHICHTDDLYSGIFQVQFTESQVLESQIWMCDHSLALLLESDHQCHRLKLSCYF